MLKSKIHRATVTQCDLSYVGSLTIDPDLAGNRLVDRTYHDANHSVLLAGNPLPVRLRRSRLIDAAK